MNNSQENTHFLAIGALVYAFVSTLWVVIANAFGNVQSFILIIAALLIFVLATTAIVTLRKALKIAPISAGDPELGKWFGIIFAAEGIGIGVGSGILVGLNLTEWIAPWVALLVGLHFFPLGYLLHLWLDYVLGAAILILILVTILSVPAESWALVLGLGTAFLLWLAGWGRVSSARKHLAQMIETKT